MPTIELPDFPQTEQQFEDCVAALFQAAGYFVERNVEEVDRSPLGTLNILEMDVVATRWVNGSVDKVLVEAKSGGWGISDVFKVLGWATYLGIERSAVFVNESAKGRNVAAVGKKFEPLRVSLCALGTADTMHDRFRAAGFPAIREPRLIDQWRWVFTIMRKLENHVRACHASGHARVGTTELLAYERLINDEVFFQPDDVVRLRRLYHAFSSHPRLTRAVAEELSGGNFQISSGPHGGRLFSAALFRGESEVLQAAFLLEQRARLAILKAAVDFYCAGEPVPLEGELSVNGVQHKFGWLPPSFRLGYERLRERSNFEKYPLIWQVFMWGFGGFYISDRATEELGLLAEIVEAPLQDVRQALDAFDVLFPMSGGARWLVHAHDSHCVVLKMFPAPIRGLGVLLRRELLSLPNLSELEYADRTAGDLALWFRRAYELLSDGAVEPALSVTE